MATYNGEKYIKAQIESILVQLHANDEIVVSDDGSSDRTIEIINTIDDLRIKIYHNNGERGYTKNFENSIKHANGDYIFLSDQDDVWETNKLEHIMPFFRDFDFVTSDALFVDENLNSLKQTFYGLRGGKQGFFHNLYRSQYLGACMAFKRTTLNKILPFPANAALCPHDLWISLIAEFYFKVKVVNEQLIKYRRHGKNASTGGFNSTNTTFRKIWFRLYCVFQIILRLFK